MLLPALALYASGWPATYPDLKPSLPPSDGHPLQRNIEPETRGLGREFPAKGTECRIPTPPWGTSNQPGSLVARPGMAAEAPGGDRMVDGFHWTRVTSKQLRFLYEAVTLQPAPPHMYELAARIDAAPPDAPAAADDAGGDGAVRNRPSDSCVDGAKEPKR